VKRRRFIVKAGGVLAAAGATAAVDAPNVIAQPKVQWRMPTAFPAVLDTLQGRAERLAAIVDEMTSGRFRIEVLPSGRIMPPFECFDAASKGTIEAFMATSAYCVLHEVTGPRRRLGPRRRGRVSAAPRRVIGA
jgi:TRAP-type mannitol/chloroaromatic compound transport system substrate-binding protein